MYQEKFMTSCRCPKCSGKVFTSDLWDYAYVCPECDENLYDFEVKSEGNIEITVPMTEKQYGYTRIALLTALCENTSLPKLLYTRFNSVNDGSIAIGFSKVLDEDQVSYFVRSIHWADKVYRKYGNNGYDGPGAAAEMAKKITEGILSLEKQSRGIFSMSEQDWEIDNILKQIHERMVSVPEIGKISHEKYEAIAEFVRKRDQIEALENALEDHLSSCLGYKNLVHSILSNAAFAARIFDNNTCCTGDMEWHAIVDIVHQFGGAASYIVTSNLGTEDELENEVILMKSDAERYLEKIREKNNGADSLKPGSCFIYEATTNDEIDMAYVDSIWYIGDVKL